MRLVMITAIAALATAPALAQGGPGGGGVGASPPIMPPDHISMDPGPADAARDTAPGQRDQFGRAIVDERGDPTMERVGRYRERSAARRTQTDAMAEAARAGRPVPADAAQIRQAFHEDMETWRDAFRIGSQDWQQQRQQWIDSQGQLSASEWAIRRADWFAALDTWIDQQAATARGPAR
jgi:hypothetical protein